MSSNWPQISTGDKGDLFILLYSYLLRKLQKQTIVVTINVMLPTYIYIYSNGWCLILTGTRMSALHCK